MTTFNCCKPVYWQHEDGWDVYRQDECERVMATDIHGKNPKPRWSPKWPGNNTLVEDAPTRAEAVEAVKALHLNLFGMECFAPERMDA